MSDGKHCELCGASYIVTPRLPFRFVPTTPKFRFMCPNPGCDITKMYRSEDLSAEEEAELRLGGENEVVDWYLNEFKARR